MNYDVYVNVRVVVADIAADSAVEAAREARCVLENSLNNGTDVALPIVDIGSFECGNGSVFAVYPISPDEDDEDEGIDYVEIDIVTLEEKGRY